MKTDNLHYVIAHLRPNMNRHATIDARISDRTYWPIRQATARISHPTHDALTAAYRLLLWLKK